MRFQSLFFASLAATLTITSAAPFTVTPPTAPRVLSQRSVTSHSNHDGSLSSHPAPQPPLAHLTTRQLEMILIARTLSRSSSKSGKSTNSVSSTSSTRSIRSKHYVQCQGPLPGGAIHRRTNGDEPPPTTFAAAPPHNTNQLIGTGSAGVQVFVSTDPTHANSVVKILPGTLPATEKIELKALHKVRQLRAWGTFDGKTYIIMEHIHGVPLAKLGLYTDVKKDATKLAEFFAHVRKLLAVEVKMYKDKYGVVHTDLHGGNVLFEGTTLQTLKVKLIDWGQVQFIGDGCKVSDAEIDATLNDKDASAAFYPEPKY